MNNKIKEILDKLQKVANRETASRNALMEMKDKDYQLLLDYITNLQEENRLLKELNVCVGCENNFDYKSRNEKANTLLDEMLKRAYIDGEYIMYDYSTSELLEVKQALQGEDKE